jgi:hypothetical protein
MAYGDAREQMFFLFTSGFTDHAVAERLGKSLSHVAGERTVWRTKLQPLDESKRFKPTLPSVSILEKDLGLTPADYYAGKAAQAAAGLS